ncbi:MAG: alpha/beta fold hydrolase [Bacteroidetes bacterium]|nr:alpha/beta fold hydrolase [Bacteroidota bacterium]
MGKKIIIGSGILSVLAFFGSQFLESHHSPLTDFTRIICFPFFTLVFLLALFLTRIRQISPKPLVRKIFRGMRVVAFLGVGWFLIAVFFPRSYGSVPVQERAGTRYWNLSTGSRIAYTLIPGKGARKPYPIIYLQGGPGGTIEDGLIQLMRPISEEGYDVYLYDQIGSGRSDRLVNVRDYTADRHKRDLEAIVKEIGAQKVILIGQSWGAILAALFAADDPRLVAGMILTGPGPIQPLRPSLASVEAPDSLHLREPYYSNAQGYKLASNIRTRAMEWVATTFGIRLASDQEADDFEGYLNVLVNRSTVSDTSRIGHGRAGASAGFYVRVMTVLSFNRLADPRPKLRGSSVPVLVMKGQYDNQKWGFTREYLELFPRHELVVFPGAGHCIFCEQREKYLLVIKDYCAKL